MTSVRLARMRRLLAFGCCAVYLVFGFVAGVAHVHESAGHPEDTHGLHVDHAHLDSAVDHGPAGHHEPASPENGDGRVDSLHLTAMALRSFDTSQRVLPATLSVGGTIEPPGRVSVRGEDLPQQRGEPPRSGPTRLRAPPA